MATIEISRSLVRIRVGGSFFTISPLLPKLEKRISDILLILELGAVVRDHERRALSLRSRLSYATTSSVKFRASSVKFRD